jgi:hypothetical protein
MEPSYYPQRLHHYHGHIIYLNLYISTLCAGQDELKELKALDSEHLQSFLPISRRGIKLCMFTGF